MGARCGTSCNYRSRRSNGIWVKKYGDDRIHPHVEDHDEAGNARAAERRDPHCTQQRGCILYAARRQRASLGITKLATVPRSTHVLT